MPSEVVPMTSFWTKDFIDQLSDREFRHAFMADQVRSHIALAIRVLREQEGREWSQTELGKRCDKPQSWISKLEDPEYGKVTLQTLLDIAEAFDLPLLVQSPEWGDWLRRMKNQSRRDLEKDSFDAESLNRSAETSGREKNTERVERSNVAKTDAGKWRAGNDNRISYSVAQ